MNRVPIFDQKVYRLARRYRILPLLGLTLASATSTVLGCAVYYMTEHSVRFSTYRSMSEFGRLPPLPKFGSATRNKLFAWDDEDDPEFEKEEARIKQIDELWDHTANNEAKRWEPGSQREHLRDYLDGTSSQHYSRWGAAKDVQKRRNSAIDKLDALESLDRGAQYSGRRRLPACQV